MIDTTPLVIAASFSYASIHNIVGSNQHGKDIQVRLDTNHFKVADDPTTRCCLLQSAGILAYNRYVLLVSTITQLHYFCTSARAVRIGFLRERLNVAPLSATYRLSADTSSTLDVAQSQEPRLTNNGYSKSHALYVIRHVHRDLALQSTQRFAEHTIQE